MKEIQELIKRVEAEINKTPTGELRNLLCDANIVLQQQALNIAAVSVMCECSDKSINHIGPFYKECGKCGKQIK